jgi:hypothetical protein
LNRRQLSSFRLSLRLGAAESVRVGASFRLRLGASVARLGVSVRLPPSNRRHPL